MSTPRSVNDPFGARAALGPGLPDIYRLDAVADRIDLASLPVTVKILLENTLRHAGGGVVEASRRRDPAGMASGRRPPRRRSRSCRRVSCSRTSPAFPAVVDLAVMRDAMADLGGDPAKVNPLVPADLVIDHSVQIDRFGTPGAFAFNVEREYERNGERYQLLRWAQTAFRDLRVVPPGTGIVHQVNLEFLATVVTDREDGDGRRVAFPDTRRRHRFAHDDGQRPGRPRLRRRRDRGRGGPARASRSTSRCRTSSVSASTERCPRGSTATDLVLVVTEMLRAHGVVGAFVEFAGDGLATLALADRTTISNMSPEFGATATLFPIDDETITYLRLTGRSPERVELVERYAKAQGLWREPGDGPTFDELLELDLASVAPSVAGPRRPQDRVPLETLRENFRSNFPNGLEANVGRPRRRGAGPRQRPRRGCLGRLVPGVGPAVVRRRRRGRTRSPPPAEPVDAAGRASGGRAAPTRRSTSRSTGGRTRSAQARSPSRRSRRAPTRRTRP